MVRCRLMESLWLKVLLAIVKLPELNPFSYLSAIFFYASGHTYFYRS